MRLQANSLCSFYWFFHSVSCCSLFFSPPNRLGSSIKHRRNERHNMQLNLHNFLSTFSSLRVLLVFRQRISHLEKRTNFPPRGIWKWGGDGRKTARKKFLLLLFFWAFFFLVIHSNYLCEIAWFFNYSLQPEAKIHFSFLTKARRKSWGKEHRCCCSFRSIFLPSSRLPFFRRLAWASTELFLYSN